MVEKDGETGSRTYFKRAELQAKLDLIRSAVYFKILQQFRPRALYRVCIKTHVFLNIFGTKNMILLLYNLLACDPQKHLFYCTNFTRYLTLFHKRKLVISGKQLYIYTCYHTSTYFNYFKLIETIFYIYLLHLE